MRKTPETKNAILESIRLGLKEKDAALLAGISPRTLQRWKKEDDAFVAEMDKKRMENKSFSIGIIQTKAKDSWQAAAWWLERNYPEEYALKTKAEVDVRHSTIVELIEDVDQHIKAENSNSTGDTQ